MQVQVQAVAHDNNSAEPLCTVPADLLVHMRSDKFELEFFVNMPKNSSKSSSKNSEKDDGEHDVHTANSSIELLKVAGLCFITL